VLLEHYAGAFPTWMSPLQARVLPVADAHEPYAHEVVAKLKAAGLRVDLIDSSDQLGKRIRAAKLDKIPYVLVVGDDDVASTTLGVNPRGGDVERNVPLDEFVRRVLAEIAEQVAVV
jgi:threonyl-tRNA synthetase